MINTIDYVTIKARMKANWMAGDYATFARYMEQGAMEILAGWEIAPGSRLLDVGCGTGQTAIPAARAGVDVTGIDIASNWIDVARARAAAEGLNATFDVGDAEQLPYPDASFDVVISMVGAMFAPQAERVASELLRVCKPGGRVLMVNWTPTGMVGQMFKAIGKHVPPPAGVAPAALWGDEATVRERFGNGIRSVEMTRKIYPSFNYPFAVPEVVEFFRKYYGPMQKAFAALESDGQQALRQDLEQVFAAHNASANGTTALRSEYLEVIVTRR